MKVLEMEEITKVYPASGVKANDEVDFTLYQGEIHAILGQNGAGKTTLMDILYGLVRADEGSIKIRGKEVVIRSPEDAIEQGVGMVHQHLSLAQAMTVVENVVAGREPRTLGLLVDWDKARGDIKTLSRRYKLQVDPDVYIKSLSLAVQQRVEILKALYGKDIQILILDEPTAVLTPQETEELFVVMRSLAEQGMSIIFITHKLKEVLAIADRITVLRDGRVMGATIPEETSEEELATMMVGRKVNNLIEKGPSQLGESILEVEGLSVADDQGKIAVDDVSFRVHTGEIIGIASMPNHGQTELVEALVGLRPIERGRLWIQKNIDVGYIPEDRQRDGLILSFPVAQNLALRDYRRPPFARGMVVDWRVIYNYAKRLVERFSIITPSVSTRTSLLSGGNLQRVVVARECSGEVKLLIASQPTRGLDIAATKETHRQLLKMRDSGCAIVLVSAELEEIIGLSDRIIVMFAGKMIPSRGASREEIGLLMMGGSPQNELAFNKHGGG